MKVFGQTQIRHKPQGSFSEAPGSLICFVFSEFSRIDIIIVLALLSRKLPFDCLQNHEWDIYIQHGPERHC